MNQHKVCVLICNHNYSHYIEDAIKSALDQDYENTTICIVDDCSTDNSLSIIDSYLHNDIYYISTKVYQDNLNSTFYEYKLSNNIDVLLIALHKNVGPSEARNVGIQNSLDCNFYQILDADDIMKSNKVSTLVAYAQQSNQIGVVYADYDILNTETGNVIREYKEPFDKTRLIQECIVHSGALIRKEALVSVKDEFGYYDKYMRCAEDYDLWIRISDKFIIFHCPESLTTVRNHPQNSTLTVDKTVWNSNLNRIAQKIQIRQNAKF